MLTQINQYLKMIKFSHSIFALPFALIAFLQSLNGSGLLSDSGIPNSSFYILLLQIIIAMVSLRSAAMGFNRIVDRKIDAENPRTASREIPSGKIALSKAWTFVIISLVIFVADAFWIHNLAGLLSPVAIILALGYSFTKRFTMFAHYVLGLSIGLAPLAAWIAVRSEFNLLSALWTLGLMFYISGFDILYSCQDAEYDKSKNLYSIPSRLGIPAALWIARFGHLLAMIFFVSSAVISGAGLIFYITLIITAILFIIEHLLVRPGKLDRIPIAFFHINAVISMVIFLGLLLDYFWSVPNLL
jgi:4-hydroxybenzoate polyprenyltransferase